MGCYISKPDDKVYITEGKGRNFIYATASCQGWRREQEDAEACLPDFDDDASLFILCDGHGGSEVAKYTVQHLPDFLKNHDLYKEGKYAQALGQTFIDFDKLMRTDRVMKELTKMAFDDQNKKDGNTDNEAEVDCKEETNGDVGAAASSANDNNEASGNNEAASGSGSTDSAAASSSGAGPSTSNGSSGIDSIAEDVDPETLRREAQIPLEELISKYANKEVKSRMLSLRQTQMNQSPIVNSKDDSSELRPQNSETTSSTSSGDQPEPSSSKNSEEGPSSTSDNNQEDKSDLNILKNVMEQYFDDEDDNSEDDSEFSGSGYSGSDESEEECDDDIKRLTGLPKNRSLPARSSSGSHIEPESGESSEDDNPQENENVDEENGSENDHEDGDEDEDDDEDDEEDDDDDDDDEDDEDDDDEDDDDDDDEDDGGDLNHGKSLLRRLNQNLKAASKIHRPVMDSGCTVVVALVKGDNLYVASAGDSRCIVVMRDGQCKPMSFDHKPEDPEEFRRILRAGGHVVGGRVNGGLNLSRALGDFTYKDSKLHAKDQMITPVPDIKEIKLDMNQVEYIFLACDGIWNSMKNHQVAKYIQKLAPTVENDLTQICMALFKNCLATGTDGDGTGCDNMTCILARYSSSSEKESSTTNQIDLNTLSTNNENNSESTTTSEGQVTGKRSAEEMDRQDCGDQHREKRRCLRLLKD